VRMEEYGMYSLRGIDIVFEYLNTHSTMVYICRDIWDHIHSFIPEEEPLLIRLKRWMEESYIPHITTILLFIGMGVIGEYTYTIRPRVI